MLLEIKIIFEIDRDILNLINLIQKHEDDKYYFNSFEYRIKIIKSKLKDLGHFYKFLFRSRINNIYRRLFVIEKLIKTV